MTVISNIGAQTLGGWDSLRHTASVIWGIICLAFKPRYWPGAVRDLLGRQVLFTGIEALSLTSIISILTGISVVTQTQVWLAKFGQSEMLGPILVAVIVREVGPLLVNLIVIARSGTAMATELANMQVRREVYILDAQGIDPMVYLVMPRVLGVAISVFCLTVIFIFLSLVSGYVFGFLLSVSTGDPGLFFTSVIGALTQKDIFNMLAKTLIPGLATGAICCINGLGVQKAVTEVPQAATRSVVRSIFAVLLISAIVSVLTYL